MLRSFPSLLLLVATLLLCCRGGLTKNEIEAIQIQDDRKVPTKSLTSAPSIKKIVRPPKRSRPLRGSKAPVTSKAPTTKAPRRAAPVRPVHSAPPTAPPTKSSPRPPSIKPNAGADQYGVLRNEPTMRPKKGKGKPVTKNVSVPKRTGPKDPIL